MIQAALLQGKKCEVRGCEHDESFHKEGVCWKITQENLNSKPVNTKYCPCKQDQNLIRRHAITGYVESSQYDSMIPKKCSNCGEELLIRTDESICTICENTERYL